MLLAPHVLDTHTLTINPSYKIMFVRRETGFQIGHLGTFFWLRAIQNLVKRLVFKKNAY